MTQVQVELKPTPPKKGENIRILGMYNLSPMLIRWQTIDDKNGSDVVFLDFYNEKAYWPSGNEIDGDLCSILIDIIRDKKQPITLPEEDMEEVVAKSRIKET